MDERPVNIKQNQPDHGGKSYVAAGEIAMAAATGKKPGNASNLSFGRI
jgi:hypothetical protein